MHALLAASFVKDGQLVTPSFGDADAKEVTDNYCAQTNFQVFAELEKDCRSPTECGRRGCTKAMQARCSVCHTIVYCDATCQKR